MKAVVQAVSVAVVLGIALASCGTSKQSAARKDAKEACVELLSLGATVAEHTSVLSSEAYGALVFAHNKADAAAALDPHWQYLSESVRSIGASFVSGQRAALVADLDDLASACHPLVGSGPAT